MTRDRQVKRRILDAMMEADAGHGVSTKLSDLAYWADSDDADVVRWCRALAAVDEHADKSALLGLLRSNLALPPVVRHHIADLLERHDLLARHELKLKRRRGPAPTPSYDRSVKLWATEIALIRTKADVARGMSRDDAVKKNAGKIEGTNVTAAALRGALEGRNSTLRRLRKAVRA